MMADIRSKCCVTVLFILIVFGVGLLISGIVVAVLGSFTSHVNDEIKKVSIGSVFVYWESILCLELDKTSSMLHCFSYIIAMFVI